MNLIKSSDLAKMLGVSRQAIHDLIKKGKIPVDENKNIDIDYPIVQEYIKKRQNKKENKQEPKKKDEEQKPKDEIKFFDEKYYDPNNEIDLNEFQKTLGLTNIKTLSEIRLKEINIRKRVLEEKIRRGDYIEKNKEASIVFGYLNALNKKMLNIPVRFIDRLIAISLKEGVEGRGKIVTLWTNEISKLIKSTKEECRKIFEKELLDDDPKVK